MIEIHESDACIPVSGSLTSYMQGRKANAQSISALNFYEKNGLLENGRIGVKYMVQISCCMIDEAPKINDIITINEQEYRIFTVTNRNYNPDVAPFYECEVKSKSNTPHSV